MTDEAGQFEAHLIAIHLKMGGADFLEKVVLENIQDYLVRTFPIVPTVDELGMIYDHEMSHAQMIETRVNLSYMPQPTAWQMELAADHIIQAMLGNETKH